MSVKNLFITALFTVTVFSYLYLNSVFLHAKNDDIKLSDDIATYTTQTDKICCNKLETNFENLLKSQKGIKEVILVNSHETPGITKITLKYSSSEVTEDIVMSYFKSAENEIINFKGCSSGEKKNCTESDNKSDCKTKCSQEKKGCDK